MRQIDLAALSKIHEEGPSELSHWKAAHLLLQKPKDNLPLNETEKIAISQNDLMITPLHECNDIGKEEDVTILFKRMNLACYLLIIGSIRLSSSPLAPLAP
ncbi:hypothetical protein BU17DRAFT_67570 [Hysterangium stoloniferum]|nr:hypothetical protein BU17DRAFT_67570 [Hysterangium stoloniferum]